jgi:phenylacetic acid degradation operon negative regulatory protein
MASTAKIILEFLNDLGELTDVSARAFIRRLEKSPKASWSALKRLEDRGEIEKKRRGNQILLYITQKGKEKIGPSGLISERRSRDWDGRWYLVSFDIPETQKTSRNLLRKKLLMLGFGKLQRSLWISPYDHIKEVRKIVTHYHLEKYVEVFHSQLLSPKEPPSFASQIWDLEGLNRRYIQFIERYRPRLSKFKENLNRSKYPELFKLKQAMREELSGILLSDPQLPDNLLPQDFLGREAYHLFEECVKLLSQRLNQLPGWSKQSSTQSETAQIPHFDKRSFQKVRKWEDTEK